MSINRLKPAYLEEKDSTPTAALVGEPVHTAPRPDVPIPASSSEDEPRLILSRAGRPIRQPRQLNL